MKNLLRRAKYLIRRFYKVAIVAICIIAICVGYANTQGKTQANIPAQKVQPKLIQFGWGVPTPTFVKQNIQEMEKRPFDGMVMKLSVGKQVFLHKPYAPQKFTEDLASLQSTKFTKFTDNFVVMWATTEEGWDWFNESDWQAAEQNIRLFAKAARAGKLAGILFDPEPYGENPWIYPKQPSAKEKSFAEYSQQVRQRGSQFMQALQQELPGVKVLALFQLSYLHRLLDESDPQERRRKLSTHQYGLLAPFLNGMLDAASPNTRISDGNERSYYYTNSQSFFESYKLIKEKVLIFVDPENRSKYNLQVQVGQALYIDQLLALRKPPEELLSYHLTPEERAKWLEHNTYYALSTTDEYVWCYSEEMNWWKNQVPDGAEEALQSARKKIDSGNPLGFNIEAMLQKARLMQKVQKMTHTSTDIDKR
ncbi:hypothetical protein QT990_24360 [Microcoleus sp. T3_B1]|uniref:hypothetical protein n=1 Tax=unclassified Microcoleus TaxID=2642155 RepID=UPI002FD5D34E